MSPKLVFFAFPKSSWSFVLRPVLLDEPVVEPSNHELLGKAKNSSLGDMSLKLLLKGTLLSKLNDSEGNFFDQTKITFKEDRSLTID